MEQPMAVEFPDTGEAQSPARGAPFSGGGPSPSSRRRLLRVARNFGLDAHAAKDVVQQAYVAYLDGGEGIEDSEGWMVRVVARRCADWKRREALHADCTSSLPEAPVESLTPEQRLAVRSAVDRLSIRLRTLVEARYFCGYSEAEAAAIAGFSPASYKKSMTRALAALRRELERGCREKAIERGPSRE